MKFLPLLALASVLGLTGCQTHYTRFTSTDLEGTITAEWIAEGSSHKVETGYRIKAVERSTYGTDPVTTHYPNGWRTVVTGPTILREHVPKPNWLRELDGEVVTEETTTKTTVKTETRVPVKHRAPLK